MVSLTEQIARGSRPVRHKGYLAWLGVFVCACVPASGQRPGEGSDNGRDSDVPSGAVADAVYADGEPWEPVVPIRSSPGGIVPRDMNDRQWDSFIGNLQAQFYREGQTSYDDGTGFWIGLDGGVPKFSIGDSDGNKLTWDGSELAISGSIDLANTTQTFAPTWTGFSSAPVGNISYMDLGKVVVMWRDTALTGTSDQTFMTISNVPSAIRPSSTRTGICMVADNSAVTFLGGFNITGASLAFSKQAVSGSAVIQDVSGFTSSNSKGLPAGWLIIYPK
jgi:hypothetical protein